MKSMKQILLKILKSWKEITIILLLLSMKEDINKIYDYVDDISRDIERTKSDLESEISWIETDISKMSDKLEIKLDILEKGIEILHFYFKI